MNREERNGLTRQKILSAATRVFGIKGYAETRTDDLVLAAKVGKGTLYKYFQGKEELFLAVFERIVEDCFQEIIAATTEEATLEDSVDKGVLAHLQFFQKNKKVFSVVSQSLGHISPKAEEALHRVFFSKVKWLAEQPERFQNDVRSELSKEDCILALFGILHLFLCKAHYYADTEDLLKKKNFIKHIFLYGVKGTRRELPS